MSLYKEEKKEGVFYSTAGMKGANSLVGPAHVLLVDFMVTEKFMAKIIKDLKLPKIDLTEVEKLLQNIQKEILGVKGILIANITEEQKNIKIKTSRKLIEADLNKVNLIADTFKAELTAAAELDVNKDNRGLIVGAKESIERQMLVLVKDVDKIFKKLQPENSKRSPATKM